MNFFFLKILHGCIIGYELFKLKFEEFLFFKKLLGAPSELRARCDLEIPQGGWSLHYIGSALKRDDLAALCKTCVEIEVGDNVAQFLETMGFK